MPVLDVKPVADKILEKVSQEAKGLCPSLAVVLVGHNPASRLYVRKKQEACAKTGVGSLVYYLPHDISQESVEDTIKSITEEAIIVQLPLPNHLNTDKILNAVRPEKDVDAFNVINVGRLVQGNAVLKPCTPSAVLEILNHYNISAKKRVVIINRSRVVGTPLAVMLQQEPYNATVTVCHEHTENLTEHTLTADIIITAVGKYPEFSLKSEQVKKDAIIFDVAINRQEKRVFGDVVDFEKMEKKALITKVPGGVGVATVACLLQNTILAAKLQREQ